MVKKAIVVMTIVMMGTALLGDFITKQQPVLDLPISTDVDSVHETQQEVVIEKKEVAQPTTISPYDPIFKVVCEEYGNDWRFMSAMAYHESRFRPDATSKVGAQGMMQIMPSVAEFFNVKCEDLTNVETNIMVANLLVNRIGKMLKLTNEIPQRDQMGLILASYNGGVGHVLNARKLARNNGEDANSWSVVSKYLQEMKSSEFASANNVKRFGGVSQTLAYVDNVLGHYNHYCQIAAL
ncbi:MAG: transglycosylase SLT domain-containing protein [Rikenellaceae bacterium]